MRVKSGSFEILIDPPDYEALRHEGWTPAVNRSGIVCSVVIRKQEYLTRYIMKPKEKEYVHFKNGNPLDLRRENLYISKNKALKRVDQNRTKRPIEL